MHAPASSRTRVGGCLQIKDESLYDTLTEEEYLQRVLKNREVVDFVVNDEPQDGAWRHPHKRVLCVSFLDSFLRNAREFPFHR